MRRILLVSDSKTFHTRNTSLLEKAGFVVSSAGSAEEALENHRERKPALVISMLDLPEMAGDVLCSVIRQDEDMRKLPVILVCYDSPESVARTAACGANSWVTKPVQPQLLLQEVNRLLAYKNLREQRVPLRASVKGVQQDLFFSAVSHNISVSGLLCETDTELTADEVIKDLAIAVNSREIVTDGKVVRRVKLPNGRFRYGVQFLDLTTGARRQIGRFIAASLGAPRIAFPSIA
jgi:CheY-like chemotaxis protein